MGKKSLLHKTQLMNEDGVIIATDLGGEGGGGEGWEHPLAPTMVTNKKIFITRNVASLKKKLEASCGPSSCTRLCLK